MSGAFQVDRAIFDNPIWNNVAEFRIFFYILGKAVWSEEGIKRGNVFIGRGQYLRSYRNLREDLMYMENNAIKYYSLSQIKRLVDKLVSDGRLQKEETELGTLFTIVNYSYYQGYDRFDKDNQERRKNAERTQKERRWNNNKKDKKDNNIYSDFVKEIVSLYPGKKVKSVRDKKLPKILKDYGEEQIIRCVKRYAEEVKGKDMQYILNESTFWNTRYIDYLDENYKETKETPKEDDPYAGMEVY